ncbi:acyltransferase [Pseudomonas entomophila]|uniref:acyltransferase family protein n=1 Tax=Pseudomonas entomophila TaxID=312306 RepID=UPI0023D878C7|nr:acyltransferase [Pseudomonas entomophila]MDF0729810.1 acyltransferase [Pseudomonas entomophila]
MLNRHNSFDLIRHAAALMVLVSHHFALSGQTEPTLQGINSLGGFAVLAFFAISGYLVTQSFLRSSLQSYAIKRAARIFPALIVCAFVMVYWVGGMYSDALLATAGSKEALLKFLQISAFGRADINTVTQGFVFPESLNGSLWTLKFEFGCYVLVALALSLVRRPVVPLLILLGFCALNVASTSISHPLSGKLSIYSSVCIGFFVGAALAFHQGLLGSFKSRAILAGVGLLLMGVAVVGFMPLLASSVGFSLATLAFGTMVTDRIIRGRFDISYGLYLYAFPVQQLLINCTELGFYPSMAAAACVTTLLATLSWLCIEKPALAYAKGPRRPTVTGAEA